MLPRHRTKKVKVGSLFIGGDAPIVIQSMTNTKTEDWQTTIRQIKKLEKAGCELVRVAVPTLEAAQQIKKIKEQINIPLVADIHYSARLAYEALQQGVDKLRLNPGNIKNSHQLEKVILKAKKKKVPIRIGVNAGSLEKEILGQYQGKACPEAMVASALKHIKILEKFGFDQIVISLKASDIDRTIKAYELLAKKVNYPLHIGITEAGTFLRGTIMSSIGLGYLLYRGLGDTLRVSLTDEPEKEIAVAREILVSLGLRRATTITSCPTCGRTEIDLIRLTEKVEKIIAQNPPRQPLHIAVMGCVVNGPGEAKEADLAIVGGKKRGLICRYGKIIRQEPEDKLLAAFKEELKKLS